MIKAFDKTNLKVLRQDFDAAVLAVAKKHGIGITLGNINYYRDGIQAYAKVEFTTTGDPNLATDPIATARAKEQAEFKIYAPSFGLTPEQYGATFKFGHDTYKLVGLKPRAPKNPIIATNVANGKDYGMPERAIVSLQSAEHKKMYGITDGTPTTASTSCSNDAAYDEKFNPIGKCPRKATTSRKYGFGRNARTMPFCAECAQGMDDARRENEAEARMS